MLGKAVPVRAVCKGQIQHLRVCHGLLQTVGNAVIVVFRLYHGDGIVCTDVKEIVRLLCRTAHGEIAFQVDLAVRKFHGGLHRDFILPAFTHNRGRDEVELDVLFGHLAF